MRYAGMDAEAAAEMGTEMLDLSLHARLQDDAEYDGRLLSPTRAEMRASATRIALKAMESAAQKAAQGQLGGLDPATAATVASVIMDRALKARAARAHTSHAVILAHSLTASARGHVAQVLRPRVAQVASVHLAASFHYAHDVYLGLGIEGPAVDAGGIERRRSRQSLGFQSRPRDDEPVQEC